MANTKSSTNMRSMMYNGKHSLLPPKSPFPSITPSYVNYGPSPAVGPKGIAKPREVISHHHRTSSESFLTEEQPSWLDELLNEPDTPVRRGGHRRSSSDSFAYGDVANASSIADYVTQGDYGSKNMNLAPSWGSGDFGYYKDVRRISMTKPKTWGRDSSMNLPSNSSGVLFARDNGISQYSGSSADRAPSPTIEKQNADQSGQHDPKVISERNDASHAKSFPTETDTKRAKQQFAQRSRVRKLQYIAELERNVQVLQVEGTEVSAELEFVNQQNLILSMENKALKQRIESLAQEQLIKYLEHEVLEREVGRLRSMFQQQQLPPPSCGHRRTKSRDQLLDLQFANLSLKHHHHKDTTTTTTTTTTSGCDPDSGTVQI